METKNFATFSAEFPYRGDDLYGLILSRNKARIRTRRPQVARANLCRIFESTFSISSRIGFHDMSLRQLSADTQISIGGIYACISSKEDLAVMAGDCVGYIGQQFLQKIAEQPEPAARLRFAIKGGVYTAELMSDWLKFLQLSVSGQESDEKATLTQLADQFVSELARQLRVNDCDKASRDWRREMQARNLLLLIADWVLQNDRYQALGVDVDQYAEELLHSCGQHVVSPVQTSTVASLVDLAH